MSTTTHGKTRHIDNSALVAAFGLQPGEAYGMEEQTHSCITNHTFKDHPFEIYYDEDASCALWAWKGWAKGIGSVSAGSEEEALSAMRAKIAATK